MPTTTTGLTVVLPTFNEREWVRRSVTALRRAAQVAALDVPVVIVDDGSDDPESLQVLDDLAREPGVEVLHQPNSGRFAARAAGIARVATDYVLLLDSRVEVDPDALLMLGRVLKGEDLPQVWNFDVEPGSATALALFWTGITKVFWRRYFKHRQRTSFGVEDFDAYPKGTTAFFAPTSLLRTAMESFGSQLGDLRLASDDTRLIREIAAASPITISPEVKCRHYVKAGVRSWCRQCYFRGTTFVDGYLHDPSRAPMLLGGLVGAGLLGAAVTVASPRTAGVVLAAGSLAAGGVARSCGATVPESASVVALTPPFGVLFGAGAIRGLRMAIAARRAGD